MHLTPIYHTHTSLEPTHIQELQIMETAIATLESTSMPDLEFYALIDKISGLNVAKIMLPPHPTYQKLQGFQRLALQKIHRDERTYENLSSQAESTEDLKQLEEIERKMKELNLPQKLSYFAVPSDRVKKLENQLTSVHQKKETVASRSLSSVRRPILPTRSSSAATQLGVGFENKGNNCWANVVLHAIIRIDSLRAIYQEVVGYYLKSGPKERKNARRLERALTAYDTALKKRKPVSEKVSNDVRKALNFFSKGDIDGRSSIQEDAHDALNRLMNLYADLPREKNLLDLSPLYFSDVTTKYWERKERNRNYFSNDPSYIHKTSEKTGITQTVNSLSHELELCLSPKTSFYDLIQAVFCNESPDLATFIDTDKAYTFKMTREEKTFLKTPEELIVTLKRFSFNHQKQKTEKITTEIPVPMELELPGMDYALELDFFISHIGSTVSGGHYTCYYKDISGQWILFDDENSQFCSEDKVKKALRTSYWHHYKKL